MTGLILFSTKRAQEEFFKPDISFLYFFIFKVSICFESLFLIFLDWWFFLEQMSNKRILIRIFILVYYFLNVCIIFVSSFIFFIFDLLARFEIYEQISKIKREFVQIKVFFSLFFLLFENFIGFLALFFHFKVSLFWKAFWLLCVWGISFCFTYCFSLFWFLLFVIFLNWDKRVCLKCFVKSY